MVTDFTSRELTRSYAGTLMELTSNAAYVKLWAHVDRYNMDGVLQKPRGTVVTDRFPREDWPGLFRMADRGFFPWPVGAEPDLTAYPGNSKDHIDRRKRVLQAFEYYTEKYEAQTEPAEVLNTDVTTEADVAISEPTVQLPEPVFEPVSKSVSCETCTWEAPSSTKAGKPMSNKQKANALRLHMNSHKRVATA